MLKAILDFILGLFKRKNAGLAEKPRRDILTNYFTHDEVKCKCNGEFCDGSRGLTTHTHACLNVLRAKLGRPLIVNSGYRCPKYNELKGGAEHSKHKLGEAVDLHAPTQLEREEISELALKNGFNCRIYYDTFIHIDTRDIDGKLKMDKRYDQ